MIDNDTRKRPRIFRAAAAGLTAGALIVTPLTMSGAAAAPPTHLVISIGDSFISGESGNFQGNVYEGTKADDAIDDGPHNLGNAAYVDQYGNPDPDNPCHRSAFAPIQTLATETGAKAINLACSGATSVTAKNQLQTLATLAKSPSFVIDSVAVSIGGNDLGFADILADCTQIVNYVDCGTNAETDKVITNKDAMVNGVTATFNDISASMRAAGYADSEYDLIAHGMPLLFAAGDDRRYSGNPTFQESPGVPMSNGTVKWIEDWATPYVQLAFRAGVERADNDNIRMLDLTRAFEGHLLSSLQTDFINTASGGYRQPVAETAEWITAINSAYIGGTIFETDRQQESYHPNRFGQEAIGQCLTEFAAQTSKIGRCVAEPGKAGAHII